MFLLLLCNDKAVLGPWVNGKWVNLFTGAVIAALVTQSIIPTAFVLYPDLGEKTILAILGGGFGFALAGVATLRFMRRVDLAQPIDRSLRAIWRMPPLNELAPAYMTPLTRIWMVALRGYLFIAGGLVLIRIVQLVISGS